MGTNNPTDIVMQAILEQLTYINTHSSRTAEMLSTGVVNNVLEARSYIIDATGAIALSWGTTCGAIEVTNHGETAVYVGAGPNSGASTPSMHQVDPGSFRTLNVASRNVTIYGAEGVKVGVQAFTRGGVIHSGFIAVNGGAP
jgi:hypothetical protein